ncbi:MAG TPA: hypothetical protein VIK91_16475 [Nannocystis sp.]
MQRNLSTGFEDSYRRHLPIEQRKAVLETIARELSPSTTLGDIVDAAQELGWGDEIGEVSLGDFAQVLLGGEAAASAEAPAEAPEAAEDGDDVTEHEADFAEPEPEPAPAPARKTKAAKKARGGKKAAKAGASSGRVVPSQPTLPNIPAAASKKAGKKLSKKAAKKAAMYVPSMVDDEAMSLEQAAKLLIPIVRRLKEATMQDLEEQTGMGRRKLRFHIGQLVKHGRLKRHGMGRGTCYTVK